MTGLRTFLSFPKTYVEQVALVIAALVLIMAAVGGWLTPYDPLQIDFRGKLEPPSSEHLLGTDGSGRDVLSRLLAGAQLTIMSTFVVIATVLVIGCAIGIFSAFVGGKLDNLLMRLADIWLGFPALILALGIAASIGASLQAAIWALIFSWWPNYARLSRMITTEILAKKFVASAEALGVPTWRKVRDYVLPNAFNVLIIQVTLDIAAVMLAISGLSFIGVGAQIPAPEWGAMIADGRSYVSNGWWIVVFPGLMIFFTALSFNVIGDMLRRELDPTTGRAPTASSARARSARSASDAGTGHQRPVSADDLLRLDDVSVALKAGQREMVSAVSFAVKRRELFGVVGESGSGKTLLTRTLFGLHDDAYLASGTMTYDGNVITAANHARTMKRLLGHDIGFIPQDPFSSLNPSIRVGAQITEALHLAKGYPARSQKARDVAIGLLDEVGIPEPELAFRQHPEQFSGGMRQRIVIAIALSQDPSLLIADEPTTALDASTQRLIIDLIVERSRTRNLSVILISHNLELLRQSMDRIAVLYGGQLLNIFAADALGRDEMHPYTEALFQCLPGRGKSLADIRSIPGEPTSAGFGRIGCAFADRCAHVEDRCRSSAIITNNAYRDRFSSCVRGLGGADGNA